MATFGGPSSATAAAAALAAVVLLHGLLLATPTAAQRLSGMFIYTKPSCTGTPVPFVNCGVCFEVPQGSRGYRYLSSGRKAWTYPAPRCTGKPTVISKIFDQNCNAVPFKSFKIACTSPVDELVALEM